LFITFAFNARFCAHEWGICRNLPSQHRGAVWRADPIVQSIDDPPRVEAVATGSEVDDSTGADLVQGKPVGVLSQHETIAHHRAEERQAVEMGFIAGLAEFVSAVYPG
jgi:hypothetical protein